MNEHVEKWLMAYHDGELSGERLRQVEAHLDVCEPCLEELEKLDQISKLLQISPEPEGLLSPEQFAAQVGLRLPRKPERPPLRQGLGLAWRLAPFVLFVGWVFVQTILRQSGFMSILRDLGFWMDLQGFNTALPANILVLEIVFSGVIGLAMLGWLASWWMREQQKSLES